MNQNNNNNNIGNSIVLITNKIVNIIIKNINSINNNDFESINNNFDALIQTIILRNYKSNGIHYKNSQRKNVYLLCKKINLLQ